MIWLAKEGRRIRRDEQFRGNWRNLVRRKCWIDTEQNGEIWWRELDGKLAHVSNHLFSILFKAQETP